MSTMKIMWSPLYQHYYLESIQAMVAVASAECQLLELRAVSMPLISVKDPQAVPGSSGNFEEKDGFATLS